MGEGGVGGFGTNRRLSGMLLNRHLSIATNYMEIHHDMLISSHGGDIISRLSQRRCPLPRNWRWQNQRRTFQATSARRFFGLHRRSHRHPQVYGDTSFFLFMWCGKEGHFDIVLAVLSFHARVCFFLYCHANSVPTGSPSLGGDVAVYVFDIN